jgi:Fe-S-cluster containining protein
MPGDLQPVPFERFLAFHQSFNGEGNGMWNICAQCGGRCEQHKIGTLMPGEKEFIAAQLHLSVAALEAGYLDQLVTPRGTVDVLKLKAGCAFLDTCFHCTLADSQVKPVLCEAYPVVFEVEQIGGTDAAPELSVRFFADEVDCPLMHLNYRWGKHTVLNPRWQEYRAYFEKTAVERLRRVEAPAAWYWIVAQYDTENFDYHALERLRKAPINRYDSFTLDELMACRLGHDERQVG